jgi:hypothetical protein
LAAGRDKDIEFVSDLLKHHLINRGKILHLIDGVKDNDLNQRLLRNWLIAVSKKA